MGNKLRSQHSTGAFIALPSWLDAGTQALVTDLVVTLAGQRRDLLAILLYGSIARHDERPIDATYPSDVDLLAVFDTDDELVTVHQGRELSALLGHAYMRHLDALREVHVVFASRTLSEWDAAFVANVERDGLLLFSRGQLPARLAVRSLSSISQA